MGKIRKDYHFHKKIIRQIEEEAKRRIHERNLKGAGDMLKGAMERDIICICLLFKTLEEVKKLTHKEFEALRVRLRLYE